MRIVVTGATGFVGRHLVPELLARGHELTCVARDEAKARAFDWFSRVRFVAADLHDASIDPAALLGPADACCHLAWPGLPNYKALFHFEENLPADYRLLRALVAGGVPRLLVTGTCFEYGMQSGPLAEDAPARPQNPYALAKDALRRFLEELRRERAFSLVWARLFYMHGEGQNPNALLAQLDRAIDAGAESFPMSGGEQLRDYLPVEEVARALATMIERPACDGVVNVCSGKPTSVRRLVEEHLARRGRAMRLELGRYPYPDHEPMAFWGVADRLRALIAE